MLTEKIKWDHSQRSIPLALGITEDRAAEITGSLLFTEIDKAFTAHSLFDDEDDIPAEFTTKTAVLDSVLDDLNNQNEAIFATFEWTKYMVVANEDRRDKLKGALSMLYMMSGQDKNKFVKEFKKRVQREGDDD